MKDQLFVLSPGFDDASEPPGEPVPLGDKGVKYFCPFSAQVIGFLTYYPDVRATLDVVELGFVKPRRPLSDLLGESKQSAPMLVLANRVDVPNVVIGEANGHAYVEKTIEILRYLAVTRGVPVPH